MNHRHGFDRRTDPRATLGRRDWLKAAAAGVASAAALGAGRDSAAGAMKNIRLGITTQLYAKLPLDEAVGRIKDAGFHGALCNYTFADARFDPLKPDWQAAKKIVDCFQRRGIELVAIFGYVNLVDPDPARRKQAEVRMETLITNWKRLGSNNISTETGTLNPKSPWLGSPENATEQAYLQCRSAVERLVRIAEKSGAIISLEAYWRNIIDSVDRAERLFREVPSPALKLVMDPCNYFRKEDLPRTQEMLKDMFRRLGDRIVVAHAKDVRPAEEGTELPAAGLGVLDYPLYLRLLAQLDRPIDLLLEHLTLDDVPRAKAFVLEKMQS